MRKIIATIAAAGLLLVGGASAASAETLYRNGANKVTIKPVGAPAGSVVTKAKVTVKKGKKTVARNKNFYKAKKGKYKVTSTVTYYFPATESYVPGTSTTTASTTKSVTADDLYLGICTVTSRNIVQDNTVYEYDYLAGWAWIDYTADCPAYYYDNEYTKQAVNVSVKWRDSDYVFVENVTGDKATDLASNPDFYYVGQFTTYVFDYTLLTPVSYTIPGVTTTTPGYWVTNPASPSTVVKATRTVVVK